MKRVYNKNTENAPSKNELTTSQACRMLSRSTRWLQERKKEGLIAPIAKYGNQLIYGLSDVQNLKERLTTRF